MALAVEIRGRRVPARVEPAALLSTHGKDWAMELQRYLEPADAVLDLY
jgi:hypothetical protein